MNNYSYKAEDSKKIDSFTVEESTTDGIYFKGKFIPSELLREIKAKY